MKRPSSFSISCGLEWFALIRIKSEVTLMTMWRSMKHGWAVEPEVGDLGTGTKFSWPVQLR
jgi:hypothetical protein